MTSFAKTASFALVAAIASFGAASAQESDVDTAQVSAQTAAFTQTLSVELNTDFAAPTAKIEAKFAEMEDRWTIKPDYSFAQTQGQHENQPVRVAFMD